MYTTKFKKTKVIPPFDCTGCALCAFICPKKCISMETGKLGHLFPYVDNKKCIQCNLCVKSCPSNNDLVHHYPLTAYAAWAVDEKEYQTSTSGGAASIFSEKIIEKGGVVYGCSITSGCEIKHIRITKNEHIYSLKGSKYVQSSIEEALPLLKDDINLGKLVLFIGTPCQVAAVKSLFKDKLNNIILIDIVCHGTPSFSLFFNYIRKKTKGKDFDNIVFRDNNKYVIKIIKEGETIYYEKKSGKHILGNYCDAFFEGYTIRDSCHHCKYAQPNRISDITIGDFWGLGNKTECHIPEHKNGISLILPITDKGTELIREVCNMFNIYERPVDEAIKGNSQLRIPSFAGKRIRLFQRIEPLFGIEKAFRLSNLDEFLK